MPRTHNRLWQQVIAWPNLLRAYQRARRRKRYKPAACRFDLNWESQLLALQRELADDSYTPGPYHNFRIFEPKPRLISSLFAQSQGSGVTDFKIARGKLVSDG